MTEPLLISVREFAREIGMGRDHTYTLVREGRIGAVRVGRRVLIPRTELAAFIERELEGGVATGPETTNPR